MRSSHTPSGRYMVSLVVWSVWSVGQSGRSVAPHHDRMGQVCTTLAGETGKQEMLKTYPQISPVWSRGHVNLWLRSQDVVQHTGSTHT